MNRVANAIQIAKEAIDAKVTSGEITKEKLREMGLQLDMDLEEYANFQNLKSAMIGANGGLTLDEANTIYSYLGEDIDTFNKQPVHVKYALTVFHSELIKNQVA